MMLQCLLLLVPTAHAEHASTSCPPRNEWCGGVPCLGGDGQLFGDLCAQLDAVRDRRRRDEFGRELLKMIELRPVHASQLQPWSIFEYRVAHGETANWLNYNGYPGLSARVMHRAAYQLGLYNNHQQFPDSLNRELYSHRAANRQPFAPRGVWPFLDDFMALLEQNVDAFRAELLAANGRDLSGGARLVEHEHGIQAGSGKWFMTRPVMGYECEDANVYSFSCAFFAQVEQRWRQRFNVSHRIFEAKYLVLHPEVWIRPHTADSNQMMKVHLGLQNPGSHAAMSSCNESVTWRAGRAHLFDDSFLYF